jgi:hypothetical protein
MNPAAAQMHDSEYVAILRLMMGMQLPSAHPFGSDTLR